MTNLELNLSENKMSNTTRQVSILIFRYN